jgi:predicted nucleotidyltransferase
MDKTATMTASDIETAAAAIIRKHLGSEYRIFLFGSRAGGSARKGSDYDIGIEGPKRVLWETLARIEEELEDLPTLATIDVVDFFNVTDSFRRVAMMNARHL